MGRAVYSAECQREHSAVLRGLGNRAFTREGVSLRIASIVCGVSCGAAEPTLGGGWLDSHLPP